MLSAFNQSLQPSPGCSSFVFVRHGRTDWNKNMLVEGPVDLPLNDAGRAEVMNGLDSLSRVGNISRIITTTLRRTMETSHMISHALGGIPIVECPGLNERFFGDWSQSRDKVAKLVELASEGPGFFRYIYSEIEKILPADAETEQHFQERISDTIKGILSGYDGEGQILIVAHGGVQHIINQTLGIPIDQVPEDARGYARPMQYRRNQSSWVINMISSDVTASATPASSAAKLEAA